MTTPTMIITARRPALLAGHDNELDVLVRVQAPDAPAELPKRNPLHLALVIDRSGSMSGQPLDEAKRCAEFVLDGLQATDRLSLVVYDNQVQTLVPTMLLHDKEFARRAIRAHRLRRLDRPARRLVPGRRDARTAHEGEHHLARDPALGRLCQSRPARSRPDPCAVRRVRARAGCSTSTYGLGHGFNEELMIGMARHGQGSSYYGQTADDLMDPFREEFELSECAVRAPAAARDRSRRGREGENAERLCRRRRQRVAAAEPRVRWRGVGGDPAAGAPRLLPLATPRLRRLPCARSRCVTPRSMASPARSSRCRSRCRCVPASAFGAIAEDELVARRADELEAAYLQTKARAAARRGDWAGVARSLKRAERIAANNPWVAESLNELRELAARKDEVMFAKESAFSARAMSTRLAGRDEMGSAYDAPASAAYLRRKGSQGKAEEAASGVGGLYA